MSIVNTIAVVLVVVGALNWGLVGAFQYNLVEVLFGAGMITKGVYIAVGVAAVVLIVQKFFMKHTE
ncbi:MAG: DUF378 domain-containing protein [Gammaproteobacteria bacterium]|nr:DUF378 domain-containing protein [Gammaproteobacteria bacterium]